MRINNYLSEKALNDYKTVKRAMIGDEKAYDELFKKYKSPVLFMIKRLVRNDADAEDLTCEAFEKAFSNLSCYTPQFAFSTWLFKIASNNTIDFLRKKKAKLISIDKDDMDENDRGYINSIPTDSPTPVEETIRKERTLLMRDKVAQLKGHYRQLIELRYFDEYSYEEIADELNIPLGTVKAQLFRAKEFLYKIMQNSEFAY